MQPVKRVPRRRDERARIAVGTEQNRTRASRVQPVRHVEVQLRLIGGFAHFFVMDVRSDADDAVPVDLVAAAKTDAAADGRPVRPETRGEPLVEDRDPRVRIDRFLRL